MSRPLIYQTQTSDAVSQLPVAIIDSTSLVSEGSLPDPEEEVPQFLHSLPSSRFVIVFFASKTPKTLQMNWLRKVHGLLTRDLKKRIQKVYVVHSKWYTRALNRTLTPIVSPKFSSKIVFVKNLSELSHYMDITTIDINPAVYCDDIDRNETSNYGSIPVPKQITSIFGMPITNTPNSYWRAALTFLNNVEVDADAFTPWSRLSETDADLVHVLMHAVSREQKLRLYDYGPIPVLNVLKEYLLALPEPLINIRQLPLPLSDDDDYTNSVLSKLPDAHLVHLNDLVCFCAKLTRAVDISIMARSLGPSVMKLRNPRKEAKAISARFFRNVIDNWSYSYQQYRQERQERQEPPSELPVYARQPTLDSLVEPNVKNNSTSKSLGILLENNERSMPRQLPSEIVSSDDHRLRIPNRRAFGKVAEIMKIYDENQLL